MWQTPSKSWHHPSKINHRVNPKMGSDFCSKDRGPHKRLPRCVGKCAETWPVPACLLVMRYLAHNARCMCARDGTCSVRWVSNCAQPRDESTYEHAPEFSCASHQTEWVSCLRWSDGVRTVSPTPYTASQRNSVAAGMDLLLGCMWLFSVPRNPKNAGKTGCTQVSAWRVRAARWINGWLAGCLFGWMVWWMHGWKCVKVEMTVNNSWCSLVSWCACIDIMFTWKCKPMFSYFSYMYILPVLMHELVECLTLHANSPDVTSIPNPFLENRLPKKHQNQNRFIYFWLAFEICIYHACSKICQISSVWARTNGTTTKSTGPNIMHGLANWSVFQDWHWNFGIQMWWIWITIHGVSTTGTSNLYYRNRNHHIFGCPIFRHSHKTVKIHLKSSGADVCSRAWCCGLVNGENADDRSWKYFLQTNHIWNIMKLHFCRMGNQKKLISFVFTCCISYVNTINEFSQNSH